MHGGTRLLLGAALSLLALSLPGMAGNDIFSGRIAPEPVSGTPAALAVGDVDGDGRADAVLALRDAAVVTVLLGAGDGTFADRKEYPVPTGCAHLVLEDLDLDGHLDAVLAAHGSRELYVLRGAGDGSLEITRTLEVSSPANGLAAGDLDGDGTLDVVSSHPDGRTNVFLSSETLRGSSFRGTDSGGDVLIDDFDGDGDADLALAEVEGGLIAHYAGHGDGTFAGQPTVSVVGSRPVDVVKGDVDRDGNLDMVAWIPDGDNVMQLFGTGDGAFVATLPDAREDWPRPAGDPILLEDLNGNGRLDMIVKGMEDLAVIYIQRNDGTWNRSTQRGLGYPAPVIAAGDMNGDGAPDLLTANISARTVTVYLNDTAGAFAIDPERSGPASDVPAATGDIDRDGRPDLVIDDRDFIRVYLGMPDGGFEETRAVKVKGYVQDVGLADLDGDGNLDLVAACRRPESIQVYRGKGDGRFRRRPRRLLLEQRPRVIEIADFNEDGRPDVASITQTRDKVLILLGAGKCRLTENGSHWLGQDPVAIEASDFDGDGHLDLATLNQRDNSVGILPGDGDGSFRDDVRWPVMRDPARMSVGDFDGDGTRDIAVSSAGSPDVRVLYNRGSGTFLSIEAGQFPAACDTMCAADLDADGISDLAATITNRIVVMRGKSGRGFGSVEEHGLTHTSRYLIPEDLDRDGRIDLVLRLDRDRPTGTLNVHDATLRRDDIEVAVSPPVGGRKDDFVYRVTWPEEVQRVEVQMNGGAWRPMEPDAGEWVFDASDAGKRKPSEPNRVQFRDPGTGACTDVLPGPVVEKGSYGPVVTTELRPELVTPTLGEVIPSEVPPFDWNPPENAPEGVEYTLFVGEITGEPGDNERIEWESFPAPSDAKSLTTGGDGGKLLRYFDGSRSGREYFWYVEARDRRRGARAVSEVWRFTARR